MVRAVQLGSFGRVMGVTAGEGADFSCTPCVPPNAARDVAAWGAAVAVHVWAGYADVAALQARLVHERRPARACAAGVSCCGWRWWRAPRRCPPAAALRLRCSAYSRPCARARGSSRAGRVPPPRPGACWRRRSRLGAVRRARRARQCRRGAVRGERGAEG